MMLSCSPFKPPEALILSTAAFTPFNIDCPKAWYWPLIGPATPITISARAAAVAKYKQAPARKAKRAALAAMFFLGSLYGRTFIHAVAVISDFRKVIGIDAISFHPTRQNEEVDICHRIGLTQCPRAFKHVFFNKGKTVGHVLRHFFLHRFNCRWIISPTIAAHAMRMGGMDS